MNIFTSEQVVNFRSLQVKRGYTGNPTVKQVPEYQDYSTSANTKKSTLTRSTRRGGTGSNAKTTERLREEDLEVNPGVTERWTLNDEREEYMYAQKKKCTTSSYWDKIRPDLWTEYIRSAGVYCVIAKNPMPLL